MKAVSIRRFNAATAEQFQAILQGPPEKAGPWLAAAAEHGITEAQLRYGQLLLEGAAVERDPEQALHWFRQAAATGHAMAMNMVGRCYENGWGVQTNDVVATYWFRLAAERELDWGMYNYATSLALGRGVDADPAAAFEWLSKAAQAGHAKSWNLLGGFHEEGRETQACMATAMDCYRRAAEGGDFRGQFNYARTLATQGRIPESLDWLRRVPATATPAFMEKMRRFLSSAEQAELRNLCL